MEDDERELRDELNRRHAIGWRLIQVAVAVVVLLAGLIYLADTLSSVGR